MESAEARFKGDEPGFIYSRFSNPTVAMFEKRMALLEGAEAARATASGMAAVTAALMGQVKAGDHVVAARALFGSCLYVVEDAAAALRRRIDARRGNRPRPVARGGAAEHQDRLPRNARPTRRSRSSTSPRSPRSSTRVGATLVVDNVFATPLHQHPLKLGADCVVYSATKHIDGQGRVLGGVILASETVHRRPHPQLPAPDRPEPVAVQRLDAAEVAGDAADPRRGAGALGRADRRRARRPSAVARVLYPGRADHPQAALARRQMASGGTHARLRGRGRQGRRRSASRTRSRSSASRTTSATPRA